MLEAAERDARPALLLALDRVQDPRNLGAILRTAEATGVHGVIVTKHQSAGLTPAVARSAMGGLEHVPVARETNLVQALERLKQARVWVMGTAAEGGRAPWDVDLAVPLCLVLGGEGPGLRPLVARTCDVLLSLPMRGRIGSLNVSAAAAALCYEILRQRAMAERRERA
jgi:23S rRNA (guanosine2251-2'-O)-methyltransferase